MTAVDDRADQVAEPAGPPADVAAPASRLRRLARDPAFVVAATFLAVVSVATVLAGFIAPADPLAQDLANAFQTPSGSHWLGTDELGRDVLSRLLFAGRVSLGASLLAVGVAVVLGFPLGLFVGYRGGRWDSAAMRVSDGIMGLPGLFIVIAVIAVVGNGVVPAMTALGFVLAPPVLRLTRGVALDIGAEPFVDAARVMGIGSVRILRRHVLPHVLPTIIVQTSLLLGAALLVEAGLSFIGLGVQPPEAGWGSMLATAANVYRRQWFLLLPPGLAITLTVLALNVFGDTIRDAVSWNPPTRGRSPRAASTAPAPTPTAVTAPGPDGSPARQERPAALQVEHLTIGFEANGAIGLAVDDVSLSVRPGRTVGLVGESGCGKTITALASMALLPSSARVLRGSVRVAGRELRGLPDRELCMMRGRDIAMVFQDPSSSLDPAFTVGDHIAEPVRVHLGLSRQKARLRAIDLLDQVGIADAKRRVRAYPHEFSGGMLQRVSIAAALACDPAVLIADEPTTALDVTVQSEILELIRELQAERSMAVLLVTHDLGVVADVCDDIVVLYAGQVVEAATCTEVFDAPAHPYTQALLAAIPQPSHKGHDLPSIGGMVPPIHALPTGCRFADRCPHAHEACRTRSIPLLETGAAHTARCLLVTSRHIEHFEDGT